MSADVNIKERPARILIRRLNRLPVSVIPGIIIGSYTTDPAVKGWGQLSSFIKAMRNKILGPIHHCESLGAGGEPIRAHHVLHHTIDS